MDHHSVVEFACYCMSITAEDEEWLPEYDGNDAVEYQLKPLQEKYYSCFGTAIPNKSLVQILMRNICVEVPGIDGLYICNNFPTEKYPYLEKILEHLEIEFETPYVLPGTTASFQAWRM